MKISRKRGRKIVKRVRRPKFTKYAKKPSVKQVERICKRVVARNEENKSRQYSATRTLFPYAGAQDTNVFPVSPYASFLDIQQGTADGARIGNRIKIKSGTITFTIWPFNYNVITNTVPIPQNVMFYLFYDRLNDAAVPTPSANGDFFQNNGSTATFTGTLTDLTRWVNRDRYRVVYKRMFKLGFAINQVGGADSNNAQWSNNDYKLNVLNFKVNFTKWLVKNVKFNDNNSNPMTRGLFGMFITVPCNGSSFGSSQIPSTFTYQTQLVYEDA